MAEQITKNETTLLIAALDQAIASAKRQQNSKQGTPMIKEVYQKQEAELQGLRTKLINSK